jgi:hypothetical protein
MTSDVEQLAQLQTADRVVQHIGHVIATRCDFKGYEWPAAQEMLTWLEQYHAGVKAQLLALTPATPEAPLEAK